MTRRVGAYAWQEGKPVIECLLSDFQFLWSELGMVWCEKRGRYKIIREPETVSYRQLNKAVAASTWSWVKY